MTLKSYNLLCSAHIYNLWSANFTHTLAELIAWDSEDRLPVPH